jgi:hypothetical protein
MSLEVACEMIHGNVRGMRRLRRFVRSVGCAAALATFCFVGVGCDTVAPLTSGVSDVHNSYRQEFAGLLAPEPGTAGQARPAGFEQTLELIRRNRSKYPPDSAEVAHLTVLEGMIALQSKRFGEARLMIPEVEAAEGRLRAGGGAEARDALFAACYADLTAGWVETARGVEETPDVGELKRAASGIERALGRVSPGVSGDEEEAALYLATSAAIFLVWAEHVSQRDREELYGRGANLIGRYLSAAEMDAAPGGAGAAGLPPQRRRYVEWYSWLRGQG